MLQTNITQLANRDPRWRAFAEMLAEDGRDDLSATSYGLARTFKDVDFTGKTVLDIGSGKGLMTVFAALNGAKHVVSMEPELAGSRSGVGQTLRSRIERVQLDNVTVVSDEFHTYDPGCERFDVILSFNSIEHLNESPYHSLHDRETYERCVEVTSRMREWLNDTGLVVVTNACRYGLFFWLKPLRIKRPWTGTVTKINWRIHQNPRVWRRLFLRGGFAHVRILYPVPYRLRFLKPAVATPLANFLLLAAFTLHCHR